MHKRRRVAAGSVLELGGVAHDLTERVPPDVAARRGRGKRL